MVIGFIIALPIGPVAALCVRRAIAAGVVAGYLTGLGAALGDAIFSAVAVFGLSFVARHEAWLRGFGGIILVVIGINTMRRGLRTLDDPVANDLEHKIVTYFHYTSSSFVITVFNPLTAMAFGAAFADRNLAGVASSLPDAGLLVTAVFLGALA